MKAPYMRIVYLPDVFTRVIGSTKDESIRMIIEMLKKHKVAVFINPIEGRQAVRVSAQILSTKAEYRVIAKFIKSEAMRMEKAGK